jgi:guanylate kinase
MPELSYPNLYIITAPSGAGKTTIINRLLANDSSFSFSISNTTRKARKGELDNINYYFTSKDEFKEKIKGGEFIEWAIVHDHYYGTSRVEIERLLSLGKKIILDIDVQGALKLKKKLDATFIFITIKNIDDLRKRLETRSTDSKKTIELRLNNANEELKLGKHWKNVVLNDDLEKAVEDIKKIIYS